MQKRNFGNLTRTGSAGAANSGTLTDSAQKDRVLHLDPNTEVIYDPELNVRHDPEKYGLESLLQLRRTLDRKGQMQPIRVYPLTPELLKKYGRKPGEKVYGIAIGHRRCLSCRLTNKDDPSLGPLPRKVTAVLEPDWLSKSSSDRTLYMVIENEEREPLNHVELGEAMRKWRSEKSRELGRHITQPEIQDAFRKPAKTVGYLLQAAEFDSITKELCNDKVLTDLDSLVTLDSIAKRNHPLAEAICKSLRDPDAPRNRSLIRTAKAVIDADPEYVVDEDTWVWPDSVRLHPANVRDMPVVPESEKSEPLNYSSVEAPETNSGRETQGTEQQATVTRTPAPELGAGGDGSTSRAAESDGSDHADRDLNDTRSDQGDETEQESPEGNVSSSTPRSPSISEANTSGIPVVMVSFKMHADAPRSFNGELLLGETARQPNLGVVGYLEDGKERRIQVPLSLIQLLSIAH